MSDGTCRNDCVTPPEFPRRPGTTAALSHGAECGCGCASGVEISADNRPSLKRFNYRIGSYATIREFLFHRLNQTAELRHWTHREPDDPAVALIEGAAILGDILTFYQETYANEGFLRTAAWRESVSDLVRLTGYRLSPAIGGRATFTFELKKDEPVVVPVGFPVAATLENAPKPSDFETVEEITAYPHLNRFNLFRPQVAKDIKSQTTEFYISNPEQLLSPIDLKPGDRLMIGESNTSGLNQPTRLENAEIVIIDSVRQQHLTKIYKIQGKLKRTTNVASLVAYKLGRTFHHFGATGPDTIVDESKPVTSSATVTNSTTTSSSTIPKLSVPKYRPIDDDLSSPAVNAIFGPKEFPIDAELKDLPNNVPMIVDAGFIGYQIIPLKTFRPPHEMLVGTVKSQKTIDLKWGAVGGTVTQLNFETEFGASPTSKGSAGFVNDAVAKAKTEADSKARIAREQRDDIVRALDDARLKYKKASSETAAAQVKIADAEAEFADKNSWAQVSLSNAATLTVAREMAASALKDGAFDVAAQELAGKVVTAKEAVDQVKSIADEILEKANDNVATANSAESSARTARNSPPGTSVTIVDEAIRNAVASTIAGAAAQVFNAIDFSGIRNKATAIKYLAEPVAASLGNAMLAGSILKTSVDALIQVAKEDADATERHRLASEATGYAISDASDAAALAADARVQIAKRKVELGGFQESELALVGLIEGLEVELGIAEELADLTAAAKNVRMYIGDALFHEVLSPLFRIRRPKSETTAERGVDFNFLGTAEEVSALLDRRLLIDKPGAEPVIASVRTVPQLFAEATANLPMLRPITLSAELAFEDFPNDAPFVTVFGNIADADEGKTLAEAPIGSGDAKQVFQNFAFPKMPLTHHVVSANTPPETPEIDIFVSGRKWTRTDSFFGRAPADEIYIIREDAEGKSWVQFGDGKTGARLPTGSGNVTAIFRVGAGSFGPLKADTKPQAGAKLKNLDKIGMPFIVTGGAPREDADNARTAAPGKVQSLGRIVSLRDFEFETLAIAGVVAASASWQLKGEVPVVELVVLMETGRGDEIGAVTDLITRANRDRGAGRDPVVVVEGGRTFVSIKLDYGLKPGYRADIVGPLVRLALGVTYRGAARDEDQNGLFSVLRRRFGVAEYASSIEGTAQNVDGVAWAKIVSFAPSAIPTTGPAAEQFDADNPATYVLPADEPRRIISCESTRLLSLFDAHLILNATEAAD